MGASHRPEDPVLWSRTFTLASYQVARSCPSAPDDDARISMLDSSGDTPNKLHPATSKSDIRGNVPCRDFSIQEKLIRPPRGLNCHLDSAG